MPVGIGSTQITGISVVSNATDAASKEYVDSASSATVPSIVGQENEFLFTNGSSTSWQPIQGYTEYTTAGNYTFTVPTQASELFIEATGAGGGGGAGTATTTSYVNKGEFWFLRTSGTASNLTAAGNGVGQNAIYDGTNYIFASAAMVSSTDTITWILRTTGFGGNSIHSIAYGSDRDQKYVTVGASGICASSTDSISWTLRTAGFGTSIINTISYGNGFYFVGDQTSVTIRASTDGISWSIRTSAGGLQIYCSLYGGGYYVVSGQSEHLRVSTDTITWILRTTGKNSQSNFCMAFGNGVFVTGNSDGRFTSSTDTITWVSRTAPSGGQAAYGLHYGEGYFVGACNSGVTVFSTDAITWIARTSIIGTSGSSIYGNGVHVRSGNSGQISTSPYPKGFAGSGGGGGATVGWNISKSQISSSTLTVNVGSGGTSNTAGAATTVSWTSPGGTFSVTANGGSAGVNTLTNNLLPGGAGGTISASNNYLYANAGTAGGSGGYFESTTVNRQGLASSDATNATLAYQTTGGGGGISADRTGDFGKFGGTINYYGNTLQNSKIRSALMNGASSQFPELSYGVGGNGGGAQYGATAWVLRTSGFNTTIYALGYGDSIYIMTGASGRVSTSTDTITWILRTSGFGSSAIFGYTYGNNTHVIYGSNGTITASTNAIFWTLRTSSTTNSLGNAGNTYPGSIYVDGLHITVGSNGTFLISTDTIAWTLRTTGFGTTTVWSVAYAPDKTEKYLISGLSVSPTGLIRTSTDNISWTLRTTGTTSGINSVNYLTPNYYYFTSGGTIFSSTDSIVWISRASGLNGLYSSAVSNNQFITGGAAGSIYSSVDGLTWILRTSNLGNVNAYVHMFANNLFFGAYHTDARLIVADSSFVGNGGNGFRGGGGGGGGYNIQSNTTGSEGIGGDGYVRISWS